MFFNLVTWWTFMLTIFPNNQTHLYENATILHFGDLVANLHEFAQSHSFNLLTPH